MNILVSGGWVLDPQSSYSARADIAISAGKIVAIGECPSGFLPERVIPAEGCTVSPGFVDLSVRLKEPGNEHEGTLASELAAAVAGGITSVVCPPDTDPVLDETGLVEMLRYRAERLGLARVFPLGALTKNLQGEVLTEMLQLTQAGCVGFSQADTPLLNTQVLQRALQYASTFGYTVWLRPQDYFLGQGVAASGPLATRLGLSGVPVVAETIALHTLFELMRATGARVHVCRLSSAMGVDLVRRAKREGLPVTCDVSINSLHLTDVDIGYFDSRMRLNPPLRQQRDRDALRTGLADGTIDAVVSDHTPVDADSKVLPFAECEPGATGVELLLSLTLKWANEMGLPLVNALGAITSRAASVLLKADAIPKGTGSLTVGEIADVCVFDPSTHWVVTPNLLKSQGQQTPFCGLELPGTVRATISGGRVSFENV